MLKNLSLPTKVTVLLSLVVFVVIFAVTYLINRISAEIIITDLKESSSFAAEQIARELADRPQLPALDDLKETLGEALEINHNLTEISVFKVTESLPELAATTSRSGEVPVTEEIRECLHTGKTVVTQFSEDEERFWYIVAPVYHTSKRPKAGPPRLLGCVRVLTSLKQADTITGQNRSVILKFAPASILLLIVLLNVLFRFTIHKPVKTIQEAMAKAESGDLNAEVKLDSGDELGMISASYNRMLKQIREATVERLELIDRINNFNVELKSQVEEATAELTKRNQELWELNEKLFKMQLELFHLERLAVAGQLTATFAHEVGTPLNLISGHVQLLMELSGENDLVLRKLTLIQSQINRLSEIVRRLLDATRRPKLDLAGVNMNDLIQDVSTLIRPTLATRKIECVERLQEQIPPIHSDRKQLEQVLLNLINNSMDAMPDGGKLILETCMQGEQHVAIHVTDTGLGIEPYNLEKLFQPMFTTKDIGRGTGLGLSICMAIIKEHGGEIEVKSVPKEGTTFSILLPITAALVPIESEHLEGRTLSKN